MVAARPTSIFDLERVRDHDWTRMEPIVCRDCSMPFPEDMILQGMPACPGPGYVLTKRENGKRQPGRHERGR